MKTKHIIKILDRTDLTTLSGEDLANIKVHAAGCQRCREAFQTARLSSVLLRISTDNNLPVPTPFFQSKVLNVWRERQNLQKPIAAFRRWWQASAALVFTMLLMVFGLISFSIMMPEANSFVNQNAVSNYNLYSADSIILNQKMSGDLTAGQALEVLENSKVDGTRK